jgi:hypothetical protein
MKKTLISLIAGVALSVSANAGDFGLPGPKTGDIVQAGVNVVVNVGDLVLSLGQTALVRFPKATVETAKALAHCIHDGLHGSAGQAATAPVLCPVTVGTEAATAIVLTGVAGVQAVVAVPSKFAKEIAAIMLNSSKQSWDALSNFRQNPAFWVLNLGVCIASHVVGRAAQLGAAAIDLVSSTTGTVVELAVAGVRTGIKYASDAVVIVADATIGRAKILAKDAWGTLKGVWVTVAKAAHGNVGGNDGAIKNFLDNVVGRLVTLPTRLIMGETLDQMIARALADKNVAVESY